MAERDADSSRSAHVGQASGRSAAMELAVHAAAGDLVATRELLDVVAPRLVRVVEAVLGRGHPDVDDVVQQGLIAFVQALPTFRGECEPHSFASRIAVRIAIAARKRGKVREQRHTDVDEHDGARLPASGPSPVSIAQAERRKRVVRQLLEELPQEQAETLAMRFILGASLEEVAQATGAPVNTVRSRMRLAKDALRKRIAEDPALAAELELEPES